MTGTGGELGPEGRTRRKRSALMFLPSVGAVVIALTQGALAASFAVSGKNFKVSAEETNGSGISSTGLTAGPRT
ncbi:hypothetical protein AB0H45_28350 [Streptomyces atroolivaceus]|uniref:Uncharacterized protein n=1 Tax=Streptomyces atroolivaceus TaxID=66869 RepID=A0ABV9V841_STRAZ|nr:hypothetical protein [Streptomyces atroolivaceus]